MLLDQFHSVVKFSGAGDFLKQCFIHIQYKLYWLCLFSTITEQLSTSLLPGYANEVGAGTDGSYFWYRAKPIIFPHFRGHMLWWVYIQGCSVISRDLSDKSGKWRIQWADVVQPLLRFTMQLTVYHSILCDSCYDCSPDEGVRGKGIMNINILVWATVSWNKYECACRPSCSCMILISTES